MIRLIKWFLGFDRKEGTKNDRIYREINEKTKNRKHQEKTNRLANLFNIFGGSRLPDDPNELLKQGWKDVTHPLKRKNSNTLEYKNPKTLQEVSFDKGKKGSPGFRGVDHYHWKNLNETTKSKYERKDKYGNLCNKENKSHILPMKKRRKK